MGFSKNFNYCMEQYGYSAYRFAKIIGANNQSVVNWLSGSNVPHPKTRQKIADHFGITLAELDGDELPQLPGNGAKKERPADSGTLDRELRNKLFRQLVDNTNDLGALLEMMDAINKKIQDLK